ncbi:hypothetical protein BGW38_002112 [Lunasporangiospora selenospora]|uniref:CUE domain-containing protein n=1 Tax=Lunasporangiospora selenospora TaxID=979761 RepID=A0A9P6KDL6_9FUNG|nr:hypothetical protein BGW38_002112 [Lunasporangiospora selenospora]
MPSKLSVLPFVTPLTEPSLSEADFSKAVELWNYSLSRVLRSNLNAFWSEILQNDDLSRFLNAFLGEYAGFRANKNDVWVKALEQVVRRVCMIYRRISETIASPEAQNQTRKWRQQCPQQRPDAQVTDQEDVDPGEALLDQGLLSISVLMDYAGIYGGSDPDRVAKVVGAILQGVPSLVMEFRSTTRTVVQVIRKVQKKLEGCVGGGAGKGKGKGKGKGVSPSISPEPGLCELDREQVEDTMQYACALVDIFYSIDALAAASPRLAKELYQHPLFLQSLSDCYNYTLPSLSKTLLSSSAMAEFKSQPVLEFLRIRMLSIVNNIFNGIYKLHQEALAENASLDEAGRMALDEATTTALTDGLCRVLFEQSSLQEDSVPMYDAPIILDLEIQFNISEKLADMIVESFNGENDRMNYWVMTLSELCQFNTATKTFIHEHNMRKSERMAKEMSNMYMNQGKERSSSATISDSSYPQITVTPMTFDQEEDYLKRTILISQLQDLFPDWADGFLEACLIAFNDDPEATTMRLLEENLPSHLVTMDRSTPRAPPHQVETAVTATQHSTTLEEQDLLSSRRNIFDGDEFDVFSGKLLDKSKVLHGKKTSTDVEDVLDDKSFVESQKSSILQAVDLMYDDEYDDTYDSVGANNPVTDFRLVDDIDANADETHASNAKTLGAVDPSVEHEEVLITTYMSEKEVFTRSREARQSKKRQHLRNLTKMSDEQLEGWAVMFGRNPKRDRIAQKYEFKGEQAVIERVEQVDKRRGGRLPPAEKEDHASKPHDRSPKTSSPSQKKPQSPRPQQTKSQNQQHQGGRPQGQQSGAKTQSPKTSGGGGGGSGGGGNNNNSGDTARERSTSERQKSSKANHNRRNQHAKKMASMNP